MNKQTEALKLALEALEDAKKNHGLVYVTELCAIREALAEQPAQQQEPVAKVNDDGFIVETGLLISPGQLLYTSPPASKPWVGLTDREIDDLYCEHHDEYGCQLSATGYERAIEAKLREKNA